MFNLYHIHFEKEEGVPGAIKIFAANEEAANRIFVANFGPNKHHKTEFVREATKEECEEVENTGGPSPSRMEKLISKIKNCK